MLNELGLKTFPSQCELRVQREFVSLFRNCPIPDDEILQNLGLFINSNLLARMLFLHHVYRLQLEIHGVIMDFGTRWGQNMAIFTALRGIYEPFNKYRKIIGFDTFEGLRSISREDGSDGAVKYGGYGVTKDYRKYLDRIMVCQEQSNPISHIKKYEIVRGDIIKTLGDYLSRHPETIVSLAYLDMGLYKPTKMTLELLKPHLTKGAVIVFDELTDESFPGETIALREIFDGKFKLERLPITRAAYLIWGLE